MKKYEYKIIAPDLGENLPDHRRKFSFDIDSNYLNLLGKDGWEMVNAIPSAQLGDKTDYLNLDPRGMVVFIFKREIV
jgi:hypothetical protein